MIIPNQVSDSSPWVERFSPLIPKGGLVLDLACGSGRHASLLAHQGYNVLAVDREIAALNALIKTLPIEVGAKIESFEVNLEGDSWPLGDLPRFDGVVVTNYLYRPYVDRLLPILNPGGVLIYETFALGNEQFGKPSNPEFLLKPNELLGLIEANRGFQIVSFEQGLVKFPKSASIQRICAVKGGSIPLQLTNEC